MGIYSECVGRKGHVYTQGWTTVCDQVLRYEKGVSVVYFSGVGVGRGIVAEHRTDQDSPVGTIRQRDVFVFSLSLDL